MKGIRGLSEKIMPIFKDIIAELGQISWIAALTMAAIAGILYLMGNEFGAKKLCKNAIIGYIIIQVVSMLA